jgi:hypothetical protein
MILTAALAILIAAQPADGPKLAPGQEMVYRGTHVEESRPNGIPFRRELQIEICVFVRDCQPQSSTVAFCTAIAAPGHSATGLARFELATVDARGRVRLANGNSPVFVPDGPPVAECAGFVARPAVPADSWIDSAQPPIRWRSLGIDSTRLPRCVKLVGEQDSDWNKPSSTRASWRRTDTVWINNSTGLVERLVREVDCRSQSAEDTRHSRTTYDLVDGISTFPGPLGADRQTEIQQAANFQQELRGLQANRSATPAAYAKLIAKIDAYTEASPVTPFRAAITAMRSRADAGRRGEPPPPGSQ